MSKVNSNSDNERRPFQGLRSFEEKNKSIFGGRDTEINELFTLVEDFGLTVVFGKSGIGKTSLIQAGLLPELRKNFYYPTYIRIDYSSSKAPLQQVKDLLYESLVEMDPDIPPMNASSLWEYMHDIDFMKGLVIPVLILDQFEEIFTLGEKNGGVKALVTELADLVENRVPAFTKEKYKEQGKIVPSRYSKLSYRVVLSLREDYLARLEELKKYMPSIMDNRLRVVQMTISQAMDAAMKPAKDLISESVAEEIIKILPGVSQSDFDLLKQQGGEDQKLKVEPFLLSLICDRINEKRIKEGLNVITSKLVSRFNVSDVIKSFYNDTVSQYGQNVEHAIEDQLLTEGGFRKLQALGEMQRQYDISDRVIDELVSARIIRKESRDGVAYVELIHDVLAPVIRKKRDKRIEEEKERQRLEDLRQVRAKNRKRMIQIGSVMGALLLILLSFGAWQAVEVNKIQEENQRKTRSREMLLSAISLSIYTSENKDDGAAGLLSRLAYGLYAEDKGKSNGINEADSKFYDGLIKSNYKNEIKSDISQRSKVSSTFRLKIESNADDEDEAANTEHNMTPTHLVRVDHQKAYLVAFRDATFRKLTLDSAGIHLVKRPIFENLNESSDQGVSAMAYDSVGKRLAIAQYRNIYLYDEDNGQRRPAIKIPDTTSSKYKSSFFMRYTPEGSLVLALGDKLYHWDASYTKLLPWPELRTKKWIISEGDLTISETKSTSNPEMDSNSKEKSNIPKSKKDTTSSKAKTAILKPTARLDRGKSSLLKKNFELQSKPSSESLQFITTGNLKVKIKALSVAQNSMIAVGIKDRLVIIDKGIVNEIAFSKWGEITALSFDLTGKYLVLGDKSGVVYHMEIPNDGNFNAVKLSRQLAHSKTILDISFSPKDPNKIATASQDGSVAIWNKGKVEQDDNSLWSSLWIEKKDEKEVWDLLLLDASLFGISGPAMKISFSKGGGYLLVAYPDGNTVRWPSSLEKINKMICEKSKAKNFKKDLKPLYKDEYEIDATEKKYYCCECTK